MREAGALLLPSAVFLDASVPSAGAFSAVPAGPAASSIAVAGCWRDVLHMLAGSIADILG